MRGRVRAVCMQRGRCRAGNCYSHYFSRRSTLMADQKMAEEYYNESIAAIEAIADEQTLALNMPQENPLCRFAYITPYLWQHFKYRNLL